MPNTVMRLAMGQMLVEGGKPRENIERAVGFIRRAAAEGCQIVVLPECLDFGWTHPSARSQAEPIPGISSDQLSRAATAARIYVAAGLTERAADRVYNAAVLIAPDGEMVLKHRKINCLDIEQDLYAIGDRLAVAETPLGTIGLNICADNFPDSLCLGHALGRMGAQIILSPCAWAVPADHDQRADPYGDLWRKSYTALSRLYEMPVVGVSNVGRLTAGPWQGRRCIGCSLAMGNDGKVLAQGPYGEMAEALIRVDIPLTPRGALGADIAEMLRGRGCEGV